MSRIQYAVARREWRFKDLCEDATAVNAISHDKFVGVVVDGHASHKVPETDTVAFATYVADTLAHNLYFPLLPTGGPDIVHAFDLVAEMVDFGTRERHFDPCVGAVAGAVKVDVPRRKLIVAHAGDVRLYANVLAGKSFRFFTQDHTPKHPGELDRLHPFFADKSFEVVYHSLSTSGSEGPFVPRIHFREQDGSRSTTGLMVTRGFGDKAFHPAFTHMPDVQEIDLSGPYKHAVFALCSDGAQRNLGRLFQRYQKCGVPDTLEPLVESFYELHEEENDDDATVLFFRLLAD